MNFQASVVVPTRGGINRLPRLIDSLANQSRQDFETIFVVDGDVDGSVEYLSSRSVREMVPKAKVIEFSQNRGRSTALNAGFEVSTGEVLLRCDDDLEPKEDYIQCHLARHEKSLQGVIGLTRNFLPDTPYARVYGELADKKAEIAALATEAHQRWRHWAGNVSIPREIWNAVGAYDISYRRYGWEDVDYGYRIHAAGFPIVIAPELTTPHYAASVTTKVRSLRALHSGAARETFVEIHGKEVLPEGLGRGSWNRLISKLSTVADENSISVASDFIDFVLPFLPVPVGRKLVAMLVETSGLAGIRHPERAKQRF